MLGTLWGWISGHSAILAGLAVALLDFIFAVKPDWASNGIAHWIWLKLKSLAGLPPAA